MPGLKDQLLIDHFIVIDFKKCKKFAKPLNPGIPGKPLGPRGPITPTNPGSLRSPFIPGVYVKRIQLINESQVESLIPGSP
jgi:hypothetical protein